LLGELLRMKGEYEKAIAHLTKGHQGLSDVGLAKAPEVAPIHYTLGLAWYNWATQQLAGGKGLTPSVLARFNKAIASFNDALERKQDYPEAWFHLGTAYLRLERFDQASLNLRQAVRFRPRYLVAHLNLAESERKLGKLDDAADCYRTVLNLAPAN